MHKAFSANHESLRLYFIYISNIYSIFGNQKTARTRYVRLN